MIDSHIGLARALARRFANRGELIEDLEQVGFVALVMSADRFDPSRGVKFSTFAHLTILGELKRHFRDKRWGVRVSRMGQERYLAVRDATDDLTTELGRSPTAAEVGTVTGLEPEEVVAARETNAALRVVSLDAPSPSREGTVDVGVTDIGMRAVEASLSIAAALGALDARELEIVDLRFRRGLTQAEIGVELGISQMQVSRLLARSLATVRAYLDQ